MLVKADAGSLDAASNIENATTDGGVADSFEALTGITDESIREKITAMNTREKRDWSETVTLRLQDSAAKVMQTQMTLEQQRMTLLQILQEAIIGEAWRVKGFDSAADYLKYVFSENNLRSITDRNKLIYDLSKTPVMSQNILAVLFGMTQVAIHKILKKEEAKESEPAQQEQSVQHITKLYVGHLSDRDIAHTESSATAKTESTFVTPTVPVRQMGLDGKERRSRKTHEEKVRDYLFIRGLQDGTSDRPGMSVRQIESQYEEFKRATISETISSGCPSDAEFALLWLKAKRILAAGNGMGRVCVDLHLRMEAAVWLLEEKNTPKIMVVIDRDSLFDWAGGTGPLRLIDGLATTQAEISQLTGKSQPTVSQTLNRTLDDLGINRQHEETEPTVDATSLNEYDLPLNASPAETADYNGRRLESQFEGDNSSVLEWAKLADEQSMDLDFNSDGGEGARPWATPFARCVEQLLDTLIGPMNRLFTYPRLMSRDTLQSITPLIDRLASLANTWSNKCHTELGDR